MVTGRGLAGAIRMHYPRWVLWSACALLITANVINISADLAAMGDGAEHLTGISALLWIPVFADVIAAFLFWSSYRVIVRIFKWLTLVLLAYVATAFLAQVDWRRAMVATFVPHIMWSREHVALVLAILGTTTSLLVLLASLAGSRKRAGGGPQSATAERCNR